MKSTAIAPSNIAFTKYWGRKNEELRLPENGSISMCLSNLLTTTTVEFSGKYVKDAITISGGDIEQGESERIIKHLDRVRKIAKIQDKAKVVTQNNFPSGTGLSSSASGFAALSLAAVSAANIKLTEKKLSILARQGSGSACRSIPSGFVEWLDGNTSEDSYAISIFPRSYWDIADVIAVVSVGKKDISTSIGQQSTKSSLFMPIRLAHIKKKNDLVKKLIAEKNFAEFGQLIEAEALELHSIMLTQYPPLIYWTAGTLKIMKLCANWRTDGLPVYFTINTGQDIHLICENKNVIKVKNKLKELKEVKDIIVNTPGNGTRLSDKHLF